MNKGVYMGMRNAFEDAKAGLRKYKMKMGEKNRQLQTMNERGQQVAEAHYKLDLHNTTDGPVSYTLPEHEYEQYQRTTHDWTEDQHLYSRKQMSVFNAGFRRALTKLRKEHDKYIRTISNRNLNTFTRLMKVSGK